MWSQKPPLRKIGALQALDFPQEGRPTVLMLHGYGADAYDLASLREELTGAGPLRWVFAQGPREVEIGPGYWGRAWFPIDMAAHEQALMSGKEISYADRRPSGVTEARDQVLSHIKALGVAPEQMLLGGFSQGAMLAVEVALSLPKPPKGLILLSGTLADQNGLRQRAPALKGLKFFQSHGERDPVLPFSGALALHEELLKAGWDGPLSAFGGGHEIPRPVVRDLNHFLRTIF
ncbi:MAG: alpha/beta hydrolase [Bdellovibrionales bacterium]